MTSCPACGAALVAADAECARCGARVRTLDAVPPPTERAAQGFELPPMRIPPGTMVSVYRIDDVLGEGGMGVVYRAHDDVRNRTVALKCLHSNLAGDAGIRRRFIREAKVMRGWSHPNVVAIHDLVEHDYLLAIVMEYVQGPTLARHLERWRGRMPFDEISSIFREILDALEEAHRRGVIHRDLKPDNVLLRDDGGVLRPKVVDFGIAKVLEGTTYTMSGALLGTCRYMSPEQVRTPQLADHRSDVYSLGVTLYELCTGRGPFDHGNHFAVMMAHVNDRPRPPSELRSDLPPALETLILDALAKDPRDRPQSCALFLERLDAAFATASIAPPSRLSQPPLPSSIEDSDGSAMVLVPAGPFQMGGARRQVHLDAFYLDRAPVTNQQFKSFLDVTRYEPRDEGKNRFLAHWAKRAIPRGQAHHPVVNVSWHDARAYAAWAGKRLPTEAEWEKAARGVDGRNYPWGRATPTSKHANFGKTRGSTTAVGSYPLGASPYGALDLAGNVWEWCDDADDPAFYEDGPPNNPKNLGRDDSLRVMRGGSWMYGARSLKTFARTSFEPHYRFAGGGFRCAKTPGA